jgi:hypothetical protein
MRTLERWCSEGNWAAAAIEFDAMQAAKRAEYLDQQQRAQVEEDIMTLTATLKDMVSLSALILSSYVGQDGTLQRSGDVRDAVAMVRIALAGLHLFHPQGQAVGSMASDLKRVLRRGTEGQGARAVVALRQLQGLLCDDASGR